MNWETTKTWLIVSFLLLDIFLGWQWLQNRNEMLSYTETNADMLANTKTLLADHGLALDATIPTSEPAMSTLKAQFANPKLTQISGKALPSGTKVKINTAAGTAASSTGNVKLLGPGTWQVIYTPPRSVSSNPKGQILQWVVNGGVYRYDHSLTTPGAFVFEQQYDDYPIFDATIDASFDGKSLYSYTQLELNNVSPASDAKPVISALDALDSLADSMDKSSIGGDNRIHSVDLGYAQKLTKALGTNTSSSNYWFPVWRITVGTTVYYVNAFSGEVEPAAP